jgi:hypothetical protein
VLASLGISHKNGSFHHSWLGQERVTQPSFPDDFASGHFHHFQGATLRVEDRQPICQDSSSGAVIFCAQVPGRGAGAGVKGVELKTPEAAAHKYTVV